MDQLARILMLLFLIMEKSYVEKQRRKEEKTREERVFEEDRINMIKVYFYKI
jgi:hypothetical protein